MAEVSDSARAESLIDIVDNRQSRGEALAAIAAALDAARAEAKEARDGWYRECDAALSRAEVAERQRDAAWKVAVAGARTARWDGWQGHDADCGCAGCEWHNARVALDVVWPNWRDA